MKPEVLKRLYPSNKFIYFINLDEAIIGVHINQLDETKNRLVYSAKKIVKTLILELNYTEESAIEFYFECIEGAYYGDNTPIVVYDFDIEETIEIERYSFSPN